MSSVFLSYDRDDSDRARHFAKALERAGHSVWWDLHVRGGAQFGKVIEEALKSADAVVVLWSENSVESAWVKDEASAGRDSGRLVPVTIDGTQPPLGFRQFQTIDLTGWKGRGSCPELRSLLADVQELGENKTSEHQAPKTHLPPRERRKASWLIPAAAVILFFATAAGLLWWQPWRAASVPTVVVNGAGSNPASRALARELAVKIASLQGVQSGAVRLLNDADAFSRRPDLVFDVQATGASGHANVVLTNTKDATILWSKDFQPANVADLNQQIALSVTRVLDCAAEGLDGRTRLKTTETLKLYLNACAQFGDAIGPSEPLVGALRQVVDQAPRFLPAWRKLLLAEADQIDEESDNGDVQPVDATMLQRHITDVRALDPGNAEATLAQVALLPLDDLVERLKLLDSAKTHAPNNAAVLSGRATALRNVGRMRESIEDANRAVQLDPLSPARHGDYFAALLFAGQTEAARQELDQVERLWPSSTTATDLDFVYNLRVGDPRKALPVAQQRTLKGIVLYLEARIDRSQIDSYVSWLVNRKDFDWGRLGVVAQGLAEFHQEQLLYQLLSKWPNRGDFAKIGDIWFRPALSNFRRDPRFIQLMAQTPLLKYWRESGKWPDFCFAPDFPYDCRSEAAKYVR